VGLTSEKRREVIRPRRRGRIDRLRFSSFQLQSARLCSCFVREFFDEARSASLPRLPKEPGKLRIHSLRLPFQPKAQGFGLVFSGGFTLGLQGSGMRPPFFLFVAPKRKNAPRPV